MPTIKFNDYILGDPKTTPMCGDSLEGLTMWLSFIIVKGYTIESVRGKDTSRNLENFVYMLPYVLFL